MIGNPPSAVLILAAIVSVGAAVLVRHRRGGAPGAGTLIWLLTALAWWASSAAAGRASATLDGKLLWARLEYLAVETVPLIWFVFTLRFTGRDRRLTPARLAALAAVPAMVVVLAWTNAWHGLVWREAAIVELGGYPILQVRYGPAGWLNVVYAYGLMVSGVLNVLAAFVSTPGFYTPQVAVMLVSAAAPWLANALYMLGIGAVDMTPVAFTITALGATWALARLHLLDLIPVARALIIDNLRDAVFVIDGGGRIIDANRAACALIKARMPCIGERVTAVLPELDDAAAARELRRGDGAAELKQLGRAGRVVVDVAGGGKGPLGAV